jgi:hypothetical protein
LFNLVAALLRRGSLRLSDKRQRNSSFAFTAETQRIAEDAQRTRRVLQIYSPSESFCC